MKYNNFTVPNTLKRDYQGSAAGEAFRHSGKTDMRIEDKNKAAFIAECAAAILSDPVYRQLHKQEQI